MHLHLVVGRRPAGKRCKIKRTAECIVGTPPPLPCSIILWAPAGGWGGGGGGTGLTPGPEPSLELGPAQLATMGFQSLCNVKRSALNHAPIFSGPGSGVPETDRL